MVQYGAYEMGSKKKDMYQKGEVGVPVSIPFGTDFKSAFHDFFGDCYCGIRTEEGMIFHLEGDNRIRVNIMDIRGVYILESYIGFELEVERTKEDGLGNYLETYYVPKNYMIPYDKIIYIEILPYNPKTYKMG